MHLASRRIRKYVTFAFILISVVSTQLVYAQDQETATLSGTVLDENGKPIPDAIIRFFGPEYTRGRTTTDSSGNFQLVVDREGEYDLFVVCNRSETPGVDYVPSYWETYLQLGSTSTFTFVLEKGASLYLDEELRFVESSNPADYFTFTVRRPNGDPLGGKYSVYTYGSRTSLGWLFGFDQRLVVVPADKEVIIEAYAEIEEPWVYHTFSIRPKTGHFKLSQGEMLRVDIREHTIDFNVASLRQMLDSAFSLLKDADYAGFLVTIERQDLLDAYGLIDASLLSVQKDLYDESFAELRRAYILTSRTLEGLQGLLQVGYQSALVLSLLFVFIASASSYLVSERENRVEMMAQGRKKLSFSLNLLIAILFYAVLFSSFYFSYPGCRLVPQTTLIPTAFVALILGQLVVARSPRAFSEKKGESHSIQHRSAIIAAFSMACRNLRRRKLRTVLTLANTMILIFAFITFTSISPGYGLVSQPLRPTISIDALLAVNIPVESGLPFSPLSSSFITWLESQPNVTLISPKAENMPTGITSPIGYLYSKSGERFHVQGIIGIVPSVEAEFTGINNTVTDGNYLQDDDHQGILMSSSFRERLNVGDRLYGLEKEFVIKGFFDESGLENLRDVGGQTFIPRYLDMSGVALPCSGDQVIIVIYDTALTLPGVVISRVCAQLENPSAEEYSDFAQMIALTREYEVYVSHPNSLYMLYVGGYVEEKGVGLLPFLLLLVIANISASMLGSVKERRDEIASLSSVGLNPTHIAALFVAEAAVIGFIGGGLGYLLGISGYRLAAVPLFGALQVREKASAEWGLIALLISGAASILASLIPSMQASTIVTPSLLRKWRIGGSERPTEAGRPWVIDLPIRLLPRELEPFTGFMLERLREGSSRTADKVDFVTGVRLEETSDSGPLRRLSFDYYPQPAVRSRNELVIEQVGSGHLNVKLLCLPVQNAEDAVRGSATHVRNFILEWNAKTFEVATPYDPSLGQLYNLVNTYDPTTLYIITADPDLMEKLDPLRNVLVIEGLRPPKFVISRVDPLDIEQCMKAAEELVSRADIVCVSGGPDALCTALAINAKIQKKTMCFVVDPRPMKLRMEDPFQVLKVVNM